MIEFTSLLTLFKLNIKNQLTNLVLSEVRLIKENAACIIEIYENIDFILFIFRIAEN